MKKLSLIAAACSLLLGYPGVARAQSVFIDFNNVGQLTNNFARSFGALIPPFTYIENAGVGVDGSRAVDFAPLAAATDSTAVLTNTFFDFSTNGAVLNASLMVKLKAPTANSLLLQLGFLNRPSTMTGERLTAFMSARVNSTAQPALTYVIQSQNKTNVGATVVSGTASAGATLTAGNWYKLSATFTNIKATIPGAYSLTATFQDMGPGGTTPGAVGLTQPSLTVTNFDMTADSSVYAAFRGLDNTGSDVYDNLAAWLNDAPSSFLSSPTNRSVLQNRPTTFTALVDGLPPTSHQWLKNGVIIPGATEFQYTIPEVQPSDAGNYTLRINGSTTSSAGTLTVVADSVPPQLLSAGSMEGLTVGVCFDEDLDPATAAAPGNYAVNGVAPAGAALRADKRSVELALSIPISGAFSVQVNGVKDRAGNSLTGASVASQVEPVLQSIDINGSLPTGTTYTWKPGDYEVTAGGADIWGNADQGRLIYQIITGDFDVKTRIADESISYGSGGNIVKAGLNVRETLEAGSVTAHAYVISQFPGLNRYEAGARTTPGGGTAGWGVDPAGDPVNQGNIAAYHPTNSWVRLRRVGNTFTAYSSSNGVNWTLLAISVIPMKAQTYVGMEMTSHAQSFVATNKFLEYGPFAGYPGATLSFSSDISPAATNITAGQTVTMSVTGLVAGAPSPEILYTWQRSNGAGGFTNMPGGYLTGTSNTFVLTTPALFASDNGAQFRAIASVTGSGSITSAVATVTVTDTAAPTFTSVAVPAGSSRHLTLVFSEPVDFSTATFSVTNSSGAATILSVQYLGTDLRTLVLTLSAPVELASHGVVVNGLKDLAGNTIAANTTRTFRPTTVAPAQPVIVEIIGNITGSDLTALGTYTNSSRFLTRTPDFLVYSNLFGHQTNLANSGLDNYGARVYSYFVAPSNGLYRFYMRSDDSSMLFMNTNSVGSTNRAGRSFLGQLAAVTGTHTLMASNISLVAGQSYYLEALVKEGTGGDGVAVAVRSQGDTAVPPANEAIPASLLAFPASEALPTPVVVETYTGFSGSDLASLTAVTNTVKFYTGAPDVLSFERDFAHVRELNNTGLDNYVARLSTYFVAPSNGVYRFYLRSDDASMVLMNTNAANSTNPSGKTLLGSLNAYTPNYTLVAQNVSLTGGQKYYLEGLYKEGGGGDGYSLAIREQNDSSTPPNSEVLDGSLLELPPSVIRFGPVSLLGITPGNPTVPEGATLTFTPVAFGLSGALPYGYRWLRNGQPVLSGSATYVTPPLSLSDNGSVITLIVTNGFSRAQSSVTIEVLEDTNAPVVLAIGGTPQLNGVIVTFSEPVSSGAANAASYSISGLSVLGAEIDPTRTRVSLRTSQQVPGAVYSVSVNGIADDQGNRLAPGSGGNFTAWQVGGCGFLVEVFTNLTGTAVANLTTAPSYLANLPAVVFHTNQFGYGVNLSDNYGVRVSGWFNPPSNGLYRFYIRSDDLSVLNMNTNGSDPNGKVTIAQMNLACCKGYGDSSGGLNNSALLVGQISLTNGTPYYIEAIFKEGTGGDFLQVAWREISDPSTPPDSEMASGTYFSPAGNPDTVNFAVISAPPSSLTVTQNTQVSLSLVATVTPASLTAVTCYQWQRAASGSSPFVNIPNATSPSYTFTARMGDNGSRYRLIASAPGKAQVFETVLTVIADTFAPMVVGARTHGQPYRLTIYYSESMEPISAQEMAFYEINGGAVVATNASFGNNDRTVVLMTMDAITNGSTVTIDGVTDVAGNSLVATNVLINTRATPLDVGDNVAGYQDNFNGSTRNPLWVARGPGGDVYQQTNGMLRVFTANGDPNHLLYEAPGYDPLNQEVLARIRVLAFEEHADTRAGVSLSVAPGNSQGFDYHFKDEGVFGRHTEFLDDFLTWGPEYDFRPHGDSRKWQTNEWYWMRVSRVNGAPDDDLKAKVWLADGSTPEPLVWDSTWERGGRSGFAGIAAGVANRTAEFQVDYVLIKASGLPLVDVSPNQFSAFPGVPIAGTDSVGTLEGQAVTVPVIKLLANDTDSDGDTLDVVGVSSTSTNGGTVVLNNGSVTYTPAGGFKGTDAFTYLVSDGNSGNVTGRVIVTVTAATATSRNGVSVTPTENGTLVRFAGIPGVLYDIQASEDLVNWRRISPGDGIMAGPRGLFEFEDTEPLTPPANSRFYRTVAH